MLCNSPIPCQHEHNSAGGSWPATFVDDSTVELHSHCVSDNLVQEYCWAVTLSLSGVSVLHGAGLFVRDRQSQSGRCCIKRYLARCRKSLYKVMF